MNTKKSNLLNWRNKRTAETADPKAKIVLSDDTFVDFSELSTDADVEKVEEEIEQLSETVAAQGELLDNVEDAVASVEDVVTTIEGKIPTEASSLNQLADKDFVNESVATASADFKGTYNSLQELEQVEANANDYGFVIVADEYGNFRYDRYKYTDGEGWLFEYSLGGSSFTPAQWATINSGLTANDKSSITQASSDATTAKANSIEALENSEQAVDDSADAVHKVNNLEAAWSGTFPILDFSTEAEYGTGANQIHYCYRNGLFYRAIATHIGEWNAEHFEAINMIDLLETYENMVIGDKTVSVFDPEKEYTIGDPVIYNKKFYLFTSGHTGAWEDTDVEESSFMQWLSNLSDTIDTYIGNGKEQVVVTCSTEAQGVSMEGLTLMIYLNGSTTEAEEYTTDNHGMATFRIPVGYTYRIVFPTVAGVVTPSPVTHTASVGLRSVEVRYDVIPPAQTEVFTITFFLARENTKYSPYQGQIVVTKGGKSTTYTAGTDGTINVEIPIGTAYTVDVVKPEGLHIKEGAYHWDFVAESSIRAKAITFYEYLDGILLTDAAGNDYTFEQFKDKVDQGVLSKGDAKYIHLCTNALLTHAVIEGADSTCYVSIYEIGKRKYHDTDGNFANLQWCNNNITFTSIPNNVYLYDGKYRTAQIIAEGIERGYATPTATRLSGMSYTFTNSAATVITGFNAARGQFDALWNNRTYIDEMLEYVYDGEEYYTLSSLTAAKWSSDQNGGNAWNLLSTWYNIGTKGALYLPVPFYA